MHSAKNVIYKGVALQEATKVMIMIHGRGASAQSILSLSDYFENDTMAYIAPQAEGSTWYPYSFLVPEKENEPSLSSGLEVINTLVESLISENGFLPENIFLLGFSQGACLALEYSARNARNYGGVFALSGGLIGPHLEVEKYQGHFNKTPILIGCSDIDFHIPKERVVESGKLVEGLGAEVLVQLYPNFGHSVHEREISFINEVLGRTQVIY
tara:strand:- start:87 stop:725 length:639 start_codon:yes stop_codon:yes gene_type:complete